MYHKIEIMKNYNLAILLKEQFTKYAQKPLLKIYRQRKWVEHTGKQCLETIEKIAASLLNEGLKKGETVGIFSQNMPEWTLADIAAMNIGCPTIPVYATNSADQVKYILKDADTRVIFVGEKEQYNELLLALKDKELNLKKIIVFDENVALKNDISVYFKDYVAQGNPKQYKDELAVRFNEIQPEDTATLIYTSGTTGKPKGVILSHTNFLAAIENHKARYALTDQDISIAFLPLSHIFERAWTFLALSFGMTNIYNQDPKSIAEMLLIAKPTAMCSVPRLYEKVYQMAMSTMSKSKAPIKKLFFWALEIGKKREEFVRTGKKIPTFLKIKDEIAEKLVFKKFRNKLGGNLSFMPCGGAYVSDEVVEFFRAMRLPLIVGYGLSETTATVSSCQINDYELGSVGKPINNVEVKIGENNEILIKGKTVMKGYYNRPEENEKAFTKDGWLKTGDAGRFDEKGNLLITDRIKELIKTAGGKYIAPQMVENILMKDPSIAQAVVYGERKPYAVALITPNFEWLKDWSKEQNINFQNMVELIKNQKVVKYFEQKVNDLQRELARYEQVKKIYLLSQELSMENGEITPTFKPIRKAIFAKYFNELEGLYL